MTVKPKTNKKEQSSNCPHGDTTCDEVLHCLGCAYDWACSQEDWDWAEETYVLYSTYFQSMGIKRVSQGKQAKRHLKDRLKNPEPPPKEGDKGPSKSQLQIIELLSKQHGVNPPQVVTRDEAVQVINTLKAIK